MQVIILDLAGKGPWLCSEIVFGIFMAYINQEILGKEDIILQINTGSTIQELKIKLIIFSYKNSCVPPQLRKI